ncbi:HNH endonuclease [Paenibacillus sp. TRM 82003]|uniref:HNH endonuclease signature motif containing protein n=1 Tax=Kineococcus sp. TRM81007 TaxID=2925831 RepID=UPI001F59483B|nr:HNH endonuclease [Kineococcus sp. TRM81007]MCI2237038.1 HNH endonuclease [Kineococcus sp. TRM81007]MCI3926495.1 HNH endonuclease [Paenibacillus sp. TRM 82003]
MSTIPEPLEVGARVAELLATGRRVSTYKLAVLSALLQHCLEHPTAPVAPLRVPIGDLADRVVDLYWPQVRPFSRVGVLRQNEQAGRSLPDVVRGLRTDAEAAGLATPAQLRAADPGRWSRRRRAVAQTLAQQPLFALQRTGTSAPGTPFLYDDTWLHKKITVAELEAHGWAVELRPGVATALARVAGLLQPVLQQWWVVDVQRMNAAELDAPDLHGFLFGAARTAVARLAPALTDLQAGRCFYCHGPLRAGTHVDHVLPWARVAIDGVANLVAADARCNLAKSATLPAVDHVTRALARDDTDLRAVAASLRWPLERERVTGAAVGLYSASPAGTPLWRAPGVFDPLRPGDSDRFAA